MQWLTDYTYNNIITGDSVVILMKTLPECLDTYHPTIINFIVQREVNHSKFTLEFSHPFILYSSQVEKNSVFLHTYDPYSSHPYKNSLGTQQWIKFDDKVLKKKLAFQIHQHKYLCTTLYCVNCVWYTLCIL